MMQVHQRDLILSRSVCAAALRRDSAMAAALGQQPPRRRRLPKRTGDRSLRLAAYGAAGRSIRPEAALDAFKAALADGRRRRPWPSCLASTRPSSRPTRIPTRRLPRSRRAPPSSSASAARATAARL